MTPAATNGALVDWHSAEMKARRKARYAADRRLQIYGMVAITFALGFLAVLLGTLTFTGYKAFTQTVATVEIDLSSQDIDRAELMEANWRNIVKDALLTTAPGELSRSDERAYMSLFTSSAPYLIREAVLKDRSLLDRSSAYRIPLSDPLDQLAKGEVDRATPENQRRVSDQQIAWYDSLVEQGVISQPFNWALFFNADSRFPELAGLAGAISGSFWALLVCFLISFPVGIAAAIYLEEFAPKNRFTDLIEININNLAAVPSVVFGLLGLAVFLGWFGLPRSVPLVGGLVLSLMTLPTLIIVTRASLKSVPSSIREAALGVGASKHEAIFHHILPLAMPTIMTGTIIGLAQALGETAPLLLIGMNAFITSPPGGVMEASTALPTQIFIWADSPERGFVARTSAAILVLIGFLILMNAIAIFLRQRFERRW
ncbi:Phosphate ABC transporter, inner membrane subunit PstA2 (plasmid) [Pseudorhizobium banfieldiae]|uniref:Phosphate transport system permease protein PstA n=1 Tax=Pseudorhizobium banfieldiae TaxID=1125847 RepID=L0NNJ2_9HYPH|nr:phosphate ABC transporter permease PstA [Pseudorhizobium banfieldiae]CAD6631188.1 phosphate ABC transporter, permease protein PstA [arsenite-oxidising bacterium NT-25]CCF22047.1 Phosphate ABC transporter, inner membrane subunit PstA2 [Pseudorhizobium banfieldiae]